MNKLNAPPAQGNLLEGLSKFGSSIVGLSAFAYIAGFVKLIAMYDAINATWVIDFLVTQDIIRAGLEPMAMVGVAAAASAYIFSSRTMVAIKLITFILIITSLVYFKFIPQDGWSENWYNSYRFSKFLSYILYLASGVLIAYSVFEITINKKISKAAVVGFLIGATCALYITPTYLGKIWATSISKAEIRFPKAIGEQYKNEPCYLLGNVNSKYVIGCIKELKVGKIQLIDIGKDVAFIRE